MKIFVTGGTGAVGQTTTRRLLDTGAEVVLLTRDVSRARSLAHPRLTVLQGDVASPDWVNAALARGERWDAVLHMAGDLRYFGPLGELRRTNVGGTGHVLSFAARAAVPRLIYTSSIEAAGPVASEDVPADGTSLAKPVSPYGITKLEAERLIQSTARCQVVILRVGSVFGPGWLNFVHEIARAIVKRNDLCNWLPAVAERYLQPAEVWEVAEAIHAAVTGAPAGTYVVAGQAATVGNICERVAAAVGRPGLAPGASWSRRVALRLRWGVHRWRGQMDLVTYAATGRGRRIHRAYRVEEARVALGLPRPADLDGGIRRAVGWLREQDILRF